VTWKPFGEVEITPEEIRAAQGVTAKVSELAILGIVASVAGTGTRIDSGDECVRIEPLNRSRLSDARNVAMATIGIYSGH